MFLSSTHVLSRPACRAHPPVTCPLSDQGLDSDHARVTIAQRRDRIGPLSGRTAMRAGHRRDRPCPELPCPCAAPRAGRPVPRCRPRGPPSRRSTTPPAVWIAAFVASLRIISGLHCHGMPCAASASPAPSVSPMATPVSVALVATAVLISPMMISFRIYQSSQLGRCITEATPCHGVPRSGGPDRSLQARPRPCCALPEIEGVR